jgi:hypothetical protein
MNLDDNLPDHTLEEKEKKLNLNDELKNLHQSLNKFLGRDLLACANNNLHSKDCPLFYFVKKVSDCNHYNLPHQTPCTFQFAQEQNWLDQVIRA